MKFCWTLDNFKHQVSVIESSMISSGLVLKSLNQVEPEAKKQYISQILGSILNCSLKLM